MTETTIVGENIEIVQERLRAFGAVSWSAVIAGALTALAVSIIIVALGSGIGLAMASPFASSPSAGTLTVLGAVWLVFAQAVGYATGGFVAGRLRTNPSVVHSDEVKFRDGANGLVVWAIGVVLSSLLVLSAAGVVGKTAAGAATTAASAGGQSVDYFADTLLRTDPQKPPPPNAADMRDQVKRIIVTAVAQGSLSPDDRAYLAQVVASQSGISPDDAQHRVDDVYNKARESLTQAADTARKAAAFFSFWTFMSLLFGAVCATLGGVFGGDLRDEWAGYYRARPQAAR
jgi:hypothetical protein